MKASRPLDDPTQLLARLADLEAHLAGPTDWPGVLSSQIEGLSGHLEVYYERHEKTDIYTRLPTEFPHLAERLDRLKDSHAANLDDLARLRDRARAVADEIHRLARESSSLARAIRRAETEEKSILQGAYTRDLGAAD